MAYKKEYTNRQYKKWLRSPMSSTFGVSEDKCLDWFFRKHPPLINYYGLTKSNMKSIYLPYLKKELGKGAYTTFLGIVVAEGATGTLGWINYTYRYGGGLNALHQDVAYMKALLRSKKFGLNHWAPETGSCTLQKDAYTTFNSLHKGDIGMYYMQATLAGNACVWAHSWALTQYFGNPYDLIIDMIKSMGGHPFNAKNDGGSGSQGGNGGSGIGEKIRLPKAIYLNNSSFTFLGVHFSRVRNWLFIKYPFSDLLGNGSSSSEGGSSSSSGGSGDSAKYKKAKKIFDYLSGRGYVYANIRPQRNPRAVGWADCSGMVGYILHTVYPRMWAGGYINTSTILQYCRAHKMVAWHGSQNQLIKHMSVVKQGDIIVMGADPSCGAGLMSHVVWVYSGNGANAKVCSMEGNGWLKHPLHYFLKNWWLPHKPYMYVCRLK